MLCALAPRRLVTAEERPSGELDRAAMRRGRVAEKLRCRHKGRQEAMAIRARRARPLVRIGQRVDALVARLAKHLRAELHQNAAARQQPPVEEELVGAFGAARERIGSDRKVDGGAGREGGSPEQLPRAHCDCGGIGRDDAAEAATAAFAARSCVPGRRPGGGGGRQGHDARVLQAAHAALLAVLERAHVMHRGEAPRIVRRRALKRRIARPHMRSDGLMQLQRTRRLGGRATSPADMRRVWHGRKVTNEMLSGSEHDVHQAAGKGAVAFGEAAPRICWAVVHAVVPLPAAADGRAREYT